MSARVYFNENDKFTAAWLRQLFPQATVDDRSIADVKATDLVGFKRCHFFAGIGGWELALQLAGWPDEWEVWTGSCPCQPFSAAGKQRGTSDDRHLWPEFRRLIAECLPATVFGEQVASALGREWLSGVRADLEALAYAVGAADLCAACVGTPNIRQRLWWVADAESLRRARSNIRGQSGLSAHGTAQGCAFSGLGYSASFGRNSNGDDHHAAIGHAVALADGGLGDANDQGLQRHGRPVAEHGAERRQVAKRLPWASSVAISCADGKSRRAQPGIFPLVDGVSGGRVALGRAIQQAFATLSPEEAAHEFSRVGVLRGAGNAINPECGAEFIESFLELTHPTGDPPK